jgi:2-haloacid dehalogenase
MIAFERYTHLTFDCYGTLIDWETGILEAVLPVLCRHDVTVDEGRLLQLYAECEAAEEAGPYKRYRDVLRGVMSRLGDRLGFAAAEADLDALAGSVGSWPPFDDSVQALSRLKKRYKLVILSNVDDDMFRQTATLLNDPFDEVITAQQVGSYKPSRDNFRHAVQRLGVPQADILHVAQSLYHDHVPAKELGFTTVWVNRASRCPSVGVSPPADAAPDYEVPDMRSLAAAAGL